MIEILNVQGNTGYELMHGDYDVLAKLPEGATNGDMIKAMFPNQVGCGESKSCIYYGIMRCDKDWWNSPYEIEKVETNERDDR